MNILVTLAFHGGAYHGFQVQKNGRTVCEVFQDALEQLLGHRPDVKGCSRTDAGVHALDFKLNFHADTRIPMQKLPLALNRYLPADVRVLDARQVPEEFHARYSAHSKEYTYRLKNSAIDSPFDQGLYWRSPPPLDVDAMHTAAQQLVGKHDFAAFMSAGSSIVDTVRTIHRFSVTREGDMVLFKVVADGYLYNMVRILCGTLVEIGAGRMPAERIVRALESGKRSDAGPTLPPQGLFLSHVYYEPEGEAR